MLKRILSIIALITAIVLIASGTSVFIISLFAQSSLNNLDKIDRIAERVLPDFMDNEEFNMILKDINKEKIGKECHSPISETPKEICDNIETLSEDELRTKYITSFAKPGLMDMKETATSYVHYSFIASIAIYLLGVFLVFLSLGFNVFRSLFRIGVVSSLSILPYLWILGHKVRHITAFDLISLMHRFFPESKEIPGAMLEFVGTMIIEFIRMAAAKLFVIVLLGFLVFLVLTVFAYFKKKPKSVG